MSVIVITGGAGFIGFNLMINLLRTRDIERLFIVDNFITSSKSKVFNYVKSNNLQDNVKVLNYDVCESNFVQYLQENIGEKLDEVYHLASLASPPFYKQFPLETLDVGYIGTKNVLELCKVYTKKRNKTKLLYSSTSEVYGDALEHPQPESYYGNVNTIGERAAYDCSKRVAETLVMTYHNLFNIDTRIVRIFNTYGPHMRIGDGRIVTEVIRCLLLRKPLTIYGDGNQTRSLCYVDDTVNMLIKVMNSRYVYPVNVGSDIEVSVNQLVNIAKKVYETKFKSEVYELDIIHKSIDKDDPKVRKPDLTVNKKLIGHTSFTTLKEGLTKTMMYFKDIIDFSENTPAPIHISS